MKALKSSDFTFIEIKFEYKNQTILIKSEPYKTLNDIFDKAITKFNKIIYLPEDIHFYFLGKELNNKNFEKIGNIFSHREKVTIKIKADQNEKESSPLRISPNLLKNNIINKKNNIYLLNTKKLLFPKKQAEEIKLPLIKKSKNKEEKEKENGIENPCSCGRLSISEYCRNCRKLICLKCKTELKHKNHLFLHLNIVNICENVKNYGKMLQDDILKKIEINKNIFNKNEILDENMIVTRKQIIHQKYLNAIENYKNILNKITTKLNSENQERVSLIVNAYNDYSTNILKQLNDLEEKLDKNFIKSNKKVTFNDLRSFFDEINSKEESLNFFAKDVIKYQLKEEINTKMKSSLDKIDRILYEMSNDDSPFNLDYKYLEELDKLDILKINKDKKEKDKDKDKQKDKEMDNKMENDKENDNLIIPNDVFD